MIVKHGISQMFNPEAHLSPRSSFDRRDTKHKRRSMQSSRRLLSLPVLIWLTCAALPAGAQEFRIATFSADVTIPLNHRCMGVLPTKSLRVKDPLEAKGFVLLGPDWPIVVVAVDWCEIRNGAYDQWRDALAKAAGTDRERVLVTSLHQHDAPVTDSGAAKGAQN